MKVWLVAIVILALSELLTLANGLRVLGIFPHPAVSHFNAFRPILKGLADAGHDVTVLSHFPDKRSEGLNYHDIVLDQNEIMTESVPVSEVSLIFHIYKLKENIRKLRKLINSQFASMKKRILITNL